MNSESRIMNHVSRAHQLLFLAFMSAIAVIICFALLQMHSAFAQEASSSADAVKKFKITFPISTLGNCADLQSCKAYCEDPVNKEACVNFAKSKGFYKEPPKSEGVARSKLILEKAKAELGCSSAEECRTFCQDQANADKCAAFAKKYSLGKEREEAAGKSIFEKAKSFLGCTSEETCKVFCQDTKNHEKCSQFARMAGLGGGMVRIASVSGKLQDGLDQVKAIIEKCQQNPEYCQKNINQIQLEIAQKSSEFCKSNKDKCKELAQELKSATGSARPCNEGPGKCRTATGSGSFKPPMPNSEKSGPGTSANVQGVSTSLSIFEQIFRFFFK